MTSRASYSSCCNVRAERSSRWDRFYCTGCRAWLSPMCDCAERGVPNTLMGCQFQGDCPADARDEQWPEFARRSPTSA